MHEERFARRASRTSPRPSRSAKRVCCRLKGLVASVGVLAACSDPEPRTLAPPAGSTITATVRVEARTVYWPTFPCTQCHEHEPGKANEQVRDLVSFHTHTNAFAHGDLAGWCYQCHDRSNLDRFVLPDGRPVPFDESYLLCGGCHGEKAVDWRRGIHGLTTGSWNGEKVRRSCAHCHDPHLAALPPVDALPMVPDYQPRPRREGGPP